MNCRSCKAEVVWAVTSNGKAIPLDALPNPNGNMWLRRIAPGGDHEARIIADETYSGPRYMPHHATCPDGRKWRRK